MNEQKPMPSLREQKQQQHENYDRRVNEVLSGNAPYVPFSDSRFPSPKSQVKHAKIAFS